MRRLTAIATSMACAVVLLCANRAAAQANTEASPQAQQKSILSFSAPVRVPGATLPAGEYIFRLANPSFDQQTVEILKKDGTPVAHIVTAPLPRPEGNTSEVLMFQAANGVAPALRAWFYPGAAAGHEFVYSRDEARQISRDASVDVLAADLPAADGSKVTIVRMTSQGQEQAYTENAGLNASAQNSSSAAMLPYSSPASSGTSGSVGTTGSAGTSGAVGTTGGTSATGATIEHSGATSATEPATSAGAATTGQSSESGQPGSTTESSSVSGGEKNEHLNQARDEQRREAAKYLDRADSLLRGASAQSAGLSGADLQQIHNEIQALQRAYETTRPGSAMKDPNARNWEEQYNLVMKDLSKYSEQAVGTSGRTSQSGSSEMGSESRSGIAASPDDMLQQVRMDIQRFHDIATNPKWTPKKK